MAAMADDLTMNSSLYVLHNQTTAQDAGAGRRVAEGRGPIKRSLESNDVERWLSPMLVALLFSKEGGMTFGRLMEAVMIAAVVEAIFDDVAVGSRGLDWVHLGQLVRAELGWDHYPECPTSMSFDTSRLQSAG